MSPQPSRIDLRLTIPAASPYHAIAAELARKFAEYSGAPAGAAEQLARAVESLAGRLGAAAANGSIALTMEAREGELVVVASAGSRTEQATCPLSA
jgi:hypothetical protein